MCVTVAQTEPGRDCDPTGGQPWRVTGEGACGEVPGAGRQRGAVPVEMLCKVQAREKPHQAVLGSCGASSAEALGAR